MSAYRGRVCGYVAKMSACHGVCECRGVSLAFVAACRGGVAACRGGVAEMSGRVANVSHRGV
eukprot:6369062-Prymnesium_polylepis.1